MSSTKNARLNEDIKRELILIIQGMKDPRLDCLWTVMRVETSPDLTDAKVHVSVLEDDKKCDTVLKVLNDANGYIRGELSKRLHIRRSPRFVFVRDQGAAYARKIDRIIKEIKENDEKN